jgi:hypothetical protein
MTPKSLLARVKADSKSNYNWITSATELVKTCNSLGFPKQIAVEIKELILKCFADLAVGGLYTPSSQDPNDKFAVWDCYKSSKDEALKERFLAQIILRQIKLSYGDCGDYFNTGPEHDAFEQEFITRQIQELHQMEEEDKYMDCHDYAKWQKSIRKKYEEVYPEAAFSGRFKNDYEKRDKIFSSSFNISIDQIPPETFKSFKERLK